MAYIFSFNLFANGTGPFLSRSKQPHQLTILNKGVSAMEERLRLIEGAQESIDVEYFIYNTDDAGKVLTDALIKKAAEGVKVRMLMDHFLIGAQISPFHTHELEQRGIELRFYNNLALWHVSKAQYRNHRKSFIVDRKVAIVGGRNIADEYFDLGTAYNFLDRDMKVVGPIVSDIAKSFDEVWKSKPSTRVKRPARPRRNDLRYRRSNRTGRSRNNANFKRDERRWKRLVREATAFMRPTEHSVSLRRKIGTLALQTLEMETSGTCSDISFVSDKAGVGAWSKREQRILKYEVFKRMRAVESDLVIDSAYFIVEKATGDILEHLLDEKNVKITLLTNGLYSTDAFYVASVFNDKVGKWIKKGLNAHVYSGDIMPNDYPVLSNEIKNARWGTHSKSFAFDKKSFMIGSYNFDPRSNYYSTELGVFCDDNAELAKSMINNVNERMNNGIFLKTAKDVRKYEFEKVGFFKKLGYYIFKIPAHLFDHLL